MNPKVSLIIPVYNVEGYLEKCLDSAVKQTLKEIEIIIVNDGSTDQSLTIIERYAKNDSRVKVITQGNGGLSAARNTGIKHATGEFTAFLDSDDYIEENMMETMYNKAKLESSDVVMCNFNNVKENGEIISRTYISGNAGKDALFLQLLAAKYYSVAWANIYKRSLFIEHGISYPIDLYHEDIPTTYKLFFYTKKISIVEDVLYHWVQREGSISKSMTQKHIDDTFYIFQLTKDFLIKENILIKYEKYYIRRVFHFIFGLINKINHYSENKTQKYNNILQIIQKMKTYKYATEVTLNTLKEYDYDLWERYTQLIQPLRNESLDYLSLDECQIRILDYNETIRQYIQIEKDIEKYKTQVKNREKDIEKYKTLVKNREKDIEKYKKKLVNIKNASDKVMSLKTLNKPIEKYKAYKNLLKEINAYKS